jgi:hypothetical protein
MDIDFGSIFQTELTLRHFELARNARVIKKDERVEFDVADRDNVEHRGRRKEVRRREEKKKKGGKGKKGGD